MRKIASMLTVAFVLGAFPATSFAHRDNVGLEIKGKALGRIKERKQEHRHVISGKVTAATATNITVIAKNGTVYTVTVTGDTKIEKAFGVSIPFADIKVNDNVWVKGLVTNNVIAARSIFVTPVNTHPARAKGEVKAVSGNTVTVQTNNHGVVSDVTVKTDANTQVTKADGTLGATADVTVGSKVKVKGLWDEVLNVLNAIKIRIW